MTPHSHHSADENGDGAVRAPARPDTLDRPTRVIAAIIIAGVVIQAALAGGSLAGRPTPRDLHEHLGYGLIAAAAVLLAIGLVAHRRRPSTVLLPTRIALLLTLAVTVFAGMRASRGSADLLMLHIPLAFIILGLAARLLLPITPVASTSTGHKYEGHERTVRTPHDE